MALMDDEDHPEDPFLRVELDLEYIPASCGPNG